MKSKRFTQVIEVPLKEVYQSRGIDGFDDLLEEKLGFLFSNASWEIVGYSERNVILLQVSGEIETFEE